jgi:hypothetical protein
MLEVSFDLKMPGGKVISITAWGSICDEPCGPRLEDVTFDVWLYRNSADLEGIQLSLQEIEDLKRWWDVDSIVDQKLYDRWNEIHSRREVRYENK